jgi:hypothetical protein
VIICRTFLRRHSAVATTFQKLEGFGVTAALKEMAKLGVDLGRERLFETLDFFGDFAEADGVPVGVAAAFSVGNDSKPFPESGGELS